MQDAATAVVDVVSIAVIGGTDSDDRLECCRAAGGDLHRREPAPGDARPANGARAPLLRGAPVDDVDAVVLLLGEVFVAKDALAVPRAAQIHPQAAIAVRRIVWVDARVPDRGRICDAIGVAIDDRRYTFAGRKHWQPEPRGEHYAVPRRDCDERRRVQRAGQRIDDLHGCPCAGVTPK